MHILFIILFKVFLVFSEDQNLYIFTECKFVWKIILAWSMSHIKNTFVKIKCHFGRRKIHWQWKKKFGYCLQVCVSSVRAMCCLSSTWCINRKRLNRICSPQNFPRGIFFLSFFIPLPLSWDSIWTAIWIHKLLM